MKDIKPDTMVKSLPEYYIYIQTCIKQSIKDHQEVTTNDRWLLK